MGILDGLNLPTLAEMNAKPRACPKGASRLEEKLAKDKDDKAGLKAFADAVWKRDGSKCRCCGRKVGKSLERTANRGEVHHIAKRSKEPALKTDPRNGVLLCAVHHEQAERHKLSIVGQASQMFKLGRTSFVNADGPLTFVESKEGK